jgi:PAS domain-containing protein
VVLGQGNKSHRAGGIHQAFRQHHSSTAIPDMTFGKDSKKALRTLRMVGRRSKIKRSRTKGRFGKHRRSAIEIRRSEARMAEGQRLTRTGTWALNVVTKRCFWSPELFRILEFDPASTDPSISTFLDRVDPSDRGAVQQNIDLAIHTGKDFAQDYRLLLGGGTTKYVHSIGHPVTNKFGEIIEISCVRRRSESPSRSRCRGHRRPLSLQNPCLRR